MLDDHRLYPQALGEMLESDNYEVALVPRGEWVHIRGSQVEPSSTAARAVLLPFSWKELVARICESVRDSNPSAECRVARFEDVCVDFTKMEVSRSSGEPIKLTTQEFKTLKCFLLNPDRVFSRGELLKEPRRPVLSAMIHALTGGSEEAYVPKFSTTRGDRNGKR